MTFNQDSLQDIEKFTDECMKENMGGTNGAPGAAVIVVKNNQIILKKGYGYADVDNQIKVDPDHTLFRVGSVTKTFTAGAVMQLVEQGKIDLEMDIKHYLKGFVVKNPFNNPVTVHHLLTHTSGFSATPDSMPYEDLTLFISLQSYIQLREPVVVRAPGTSYMYDNFAYNLLGYIIQEVSGETYEEYMKKYIIEPLKMNKTHIVMREAILHDLATSYGEDNEVIKPYSMEPSELPSGGMVMTAENMAHFMIAQLNEGVYEEKILWNAASVSKMFCFQSSIHPNYPDASYGYENWLTEGDKKDQFIIAKGGDIPGYSSFIILLPKHNLGIFMVFNKLVSAAVVGRQWNKRFMNHYFLATNLERSAILQEPQNKLKRFEGIYTDLRLFVLQTHLSVTGDGELTITDNAGERKLKQLDKLLFKDEEGEYLAFKEEEDGSILYMKYRNPVSYSKKYCSAFFDIDASSKYVPFIERMEAMGVIKGRHEGQFQPAEAATRAELSVLIGKIMGIEAIEMKEITQYTDIEGHWAQAQIEAVTAMGVVQGMSEESFAPDQLLTRGQAADMLMNAILAVTPFILTENLAEKVKLIHVADLEETQHSKNILTLIATGLTGPDITIDEERYFFRPDELFTREEAAVWIDRFINIYVQSLSEG